MGGFSAESLNNRAGGSEEKLIELARELAKDNKVIIYHNGNHGVFDNVEYTDHMSFKPYEPFDIFISFKNREILRQTINAPKIFHWTTEIESWKPWELDQVDRVITISNYHTHRMQPQDPKINKIYLWADFDQLDSNKVEKEPNSMLYSSSFDRGLEQILSRWGLLKEKLGLSKLYITYGWDFVDQIIKGNPSMLTWKNHMIELMKQEGIEFIGKVSADEMAKYYWKAQYWCLPLNNPDSELFCINAVKAQYCGAIPVVRRIGALQETVNQFVDFDELMGQKVGQSNIAENILEDNKIHAEKFNLKTQIKEWKELLQIQA